MKRRRSQLVDKVYKLEDEFRQPQEFVACGRAIEREKGARRPLFTLFPPSIFFCFLLLSTV